MPNEDVALAKGGVWTLIIRGALSLIFLFSWIFFAVAFYIVMNGIHELSPELGRMVFALLGLFGTINIMILAVFLLILNLWFTTKRR